MKNIFQISRVKAFLCLLLAAFLFAGCRNLGGEIAPATTASLPPPSSQAPIILGDGIRASYADVVERVAPAVVNIIVLKREAADDNPQNPLLEDPRFRDFQKQLPQSGRPLIVRGAGSGVIVNSNGTILTNHHVVEDASDIEIQLNDKRTFKAKLVGSDEPSDLAVLKVETSNLPFLNLGDSDKTRVGDVVLALGNPLGIGQTVTLGIISAKGRRTGIGNGNSFEDFLQTDAPINRGNSGGALVNLTGELIGINSQILSSGGSGGSIGIGFAIPSNMARSVFEQLIKNGKVKRGQLGVEIKDITSDLAASLSLKETRGAIVMNIRAGSAAEKAGIKRYDVVTALNGERVEDGNTLRNHIASTSPGSEITLTVNRNGKEQQIKAVLGELSAETAVNRREQNQEQNTPAPQGEQSGKLGLGLQPLTPELAQRLQIQAESGLVVTEVDPTGPAADAGILVGDTILEINRQNVSSFEEFQTELQKSGDRPVLLFITRKGQTTFLTIEPRQ
ncbi:MAG: Do family serine endopeptidase [Pyrinomonadaceae bacterium]